MAINLENYISIIVPFYYGNKYISRLLNSIRCAVLQIKDLVDCEVIIVNDSPDIDVEIPLGYSDLNISIIKNEENLGIQKTRGIGLKNSIGKWIIFLDQDDEICSDGIIKQIQLINNADLVVGNGLYQYGDELIKNYNSKKQMKYYIQLKNFIRIRNLIASPGQCLIRRNVIPNIWVEKSLKNNGADDWFLWILMLKNDVRIKVNEEIVYIHNDSEGENLSYNLSKMLESSMEMYEILSKNKILNKKELNNLKSAIEFKYLKDTNNLKIINYIKYINVVFWNVLYKIRTFRKNVFC